MPETSPPALSSETHARCRECGYIIEGLPEPRCPECGTEFDPAFVRDVAKRLALLAWERLELGGPVRRLWATFRLAWFHPIRYFTNAGQRTDLRITRAGSLFWWSLGVAVLLWGAWMWGDLGWAYYLWMWEDYYAAWSLHPYPRSATLWLVDLALVGIPPFLAVVIIAAVFRWVSGTRSLRFLDYAALLAPAAVFTQLFFFALWFADEMDLDRIPVVCVLLEVLFWSYFVYPSLIGALCARKALRLTFARSIGVGVFVFCIARFTPWVMVWCKTLLGL